MAYQYTRRLAGLIVVLSLACAGPGVFAAWGQTTTGGTLNVMVLDPSGATIPGAGLELRDTATNDIRRAETQANGAYSFPNIPFGMYELKVTAQGFQTQVFQSVQIQTGRETDVRATLKIGAATESVTVAESATPLVQTEASTLVSTLDTKQVVNLPVVSRSVWNFVYLTPGWTSTGNNQSYGTFNNLPGGAIVALDFDGTAAKSNRFRSSGYGYGSFAVQPRIENVAEMTVQTAQLDLSGNGTSAMKISIVSRRGTNEYHGRLYEDFRNTVLNANSWLNNARGVARPILKLNEFGGSVGGPVIKNKLFFFSTWSESKQPNTGLSTASFLVPLAQQGIYQYRDNTGVVQQVNVLKIAGAAGLPSTVLPSIASQLSQINGVLNLGNLSYGTDPNVGTLTFVNPSSVTIYYPTVRIDYSLSEKLRFNASYTQQKTRRPYTYAPNFPGGIDPMDRTSSGGNNRVAGLGIDYVMRPTLINQFHAGYLSEYSYFSPENSGIDLSKLHIENWAYGLSPIGGPFPRTYISSLYPQWSLNDSLNWQRGAHSIVIGGNWFREQDKYWNGPGGEPYYNLGLNSADPAYTAITNAMPGVSTTLQSGARNLYATLVGRVNYVGIAVGRPLDMATKTYAPYGAYNLNEVQNSGGFWIQDRWRLRPNFTLNYGIRWDIVGDDYDKDGAYSSMRSLADLWGPTPVGAIFQPGVLGGVSDPQFIARSHVYNTSWKNPQPAVAFAWNPKASKGVLGKIIGTDKTVVRAGYSLRNYQEGAQNFWAFASNSGAFFFQGGSLNPDPAATGPGYFKPGSLTLGDALPPYYLSPATWSPQVSASQMFGNSYYLLNPNIRQPYVQQWNFGIQRELPGGNALEIRYVGTLTLHSWLGLNINESNIFENGFLQEFQNAQNNLKINQANGKGNTAFNNGLPGQVALPIETAAFGSSPTAGGWTQFVTQLQTGAAGAMARTMNSTTSYLCNLIGSTNFTPCAGYKGNGYPLNFWNINPYARTGGLNYLDAAGTSNYQGLQVEFRQRLTHGMQFTANYNWQHSLGLAAVNNLQSQGLTINTMRNLRLSYGPSAIDIRHTFRASGTYDLPFGKGKRFLNQGRLVDAIVGSWTLGTITVIQTGNPATISGGYSTVTGADSGVIFNGIAARDFQSSISVRKSGNPWVTTFDPKYIGANNMASTTYFSPASTPGVFGYRPTFWGPLWWNTDISINKSIPIRERVKMTLQGAFLNAFNHPAFGMGSLGILSTNFGQTTTTMNGARNIELRANVEF